MDDWKPAKPTHPYDRVFRLPVSGGQPFSTAETLRILAANHFTAPEFWERHGTGFVHRRCTVLGPDGERHDASKVFDAILKVTALEVLCRDRSDAVMGLLRRDGEWESSSK